MYIPAGIRYFWDNSFQLLSWAENKSDDPWPHRKLPVD